MTSETRIFKIFSPGKANLNEFHSLRQNICLTGRLSTLGEKSHLEDIGDHSSGVTEGVLLPNPVADQTLIGGVVEGGPQVAGAEHLAFA